MTGHDRKGVSTVYVVVQYNLGNKARPIEQHLAFLACAHCDYVT